MLAAEVLGIFVLKESKFHRYKSSSSLIHLQLCPYQILHFSTLQINCTEEKLGGTCR